MSASELRAGFGRASIIPDYSVPLLGYGNSTNRMSQGYLNPMEVNCTAIQDTQGHTLLLLAMDMALTNTAFYQYGANQLGKEVGIPDANVIIAATHTHSGADIYTEHENSKRYELDLYQWIREAAKQAVEDLAPATLQTGSIDVEHMNFVRHYIMNDGSYYGDNFGSRESGYKCHEREPDKQLQLIKLVRDGEKKDILWVNWQSHPKLASTASTMNGKLTRPLLSSDYVGFMRDYVRKHADCEVAFFLGAAGNLNPLSDIQEEQATVPENVMVYGHKVGDYVLEALKNMKDVASGPVLSKKVFFQAPLDHTEDHKAENAKLVMAHWAQHNNFRLNVEFGKQYEIYSPYHAEAILRRAGDPGSFREMEINAVSFGDVGFATAPYEMFLQNGQAVKEGSPLETTFMITNCNGVHMYIAADAAFEYGSYEVHNRTYARGTAEALQNKMIEMLNGLK